MTGKPQTWEEATALVRLVPPRAGLVIVKDGLPHPSAHPGFVAHHGAPKGQSADWRLLLASGEGLHVLEFEDHYEVHWDESDPREGALTHARRDWPLGWTLGGALVGAVVGAGVGGPIGALIGAGVGLVGSGALARVQ